MARCLGDCHCCCGMQADDVESPDDETETRCERGSGKLRVLNASLVSLFSMLGVLTRVGLSILFGPTGAGVASLHRIVFTDLPANALGCFIHGFAQAFFAHDSASSSPVTPLPLRHAVQVGFAGSLTTFAGWNYHATLLFTRGSWLRALFSLLIGVYVAYSSHVVGADFFQMALQLTSKRARARAHTSSSPPLNNNSTPSPSPNAATAPAEHVLPAEVAAAASDDAELLADALGATGVNHATHSEDTARLRPRTSGRSSDSESEHNANSVPFWALLLSLVSFGLVWVGCVAGALSDTVPARQLAWSSAAFAPAGALTRWHVASYFNPRLDNFPLGTFMLNLSGVVIDVGLAAYRLHATRTRRQTAFAEKLIIQAIFAGFAGALSTVSAFIAELREMRIVPRYRYAILSVLAAQTAGVAVYTPVYWTVLQ